MSVQEQTPFSSHIANGSTTIFPFGFLLLAASDLVVTVGNVVKTLGSDYTINGIGNPTGGDVVFGTAPPSGAKVLIKRILPLQRLTDYQDNGDLFAKTLNNDYDRLWMAIQQVNHNTRRALKLPFETSVDQVVNEDAAMRANALVGLDANGNMALKKLVDLEHTFVSPFMATLLGAPDAPAARSILEAYGAYDDAYFNHVSASEVSAGYVNSTQMTIHGHGFIDILRANQINVYRLNTHRAAAPVLSLPAESDIWAAYGNEIEFVGSASVTDFPPAPNPGASRILHCVDSPTFVHGPTLQVQGGADYTASPGDVVEIHATSWASFRAIIHRANGRAVVEPPPPSGGISVSPFIVWNSGSYADVLNIPSNAKRISIHVRKLALGLNSSSGSYSGAVSLQLGTASGIKTSGYEDSCALVTDEDDEIDVSYDTSSFVIGVARNGLIPHGILTSSVRLWLADEVNNVWVMSCDFSPVNHSNGWVALPGPINMFRLIGNAKTAFGHYGGFSYTVET